MPTVQPPIPTENLTQNAASSPPSPTLGVRRLTLLLMGLLLASFVAQLPGHRAADWQLFTIYDPGTVLKGDYLLSKGYVPTVDFGYTHGLISLLYGRVGFAVLGLHAWAFLILTLFTELVMAYALARIMTATGIVKNKLALVLVLVSLPMAIMPAYLTFTHPLEAMLILLALAEQAEGNKGRALALLTVCIFVKPSMAYVYGFLVVLLIAWEHRGRLVAIVRNIVPAFVTLVVLLGVLTLRFGFGPVYRTMLPFTGAKTYTTTHFGFFNESGLDFWLPLRGQDASLGKILATYVGVYLSPSRADVAAPIAMFVLAAAVCAIGAVIGLARFVRLPSAQASRVRVPASPWEMLLTIGGLHTTFLLLFFGWKGSWSYYSYLPVLGLTLAVMMLPWRQMAQGVLFTVLIAMMFLSNTGVFIESLGAWAVKQRVPPGPGADAGLYDWPAFDGRPSLTSQWQEILKFVGSKQTVIMTDGWLPNLPANIQMRDAWFPQPGIPTAAEIARVKKQVDGAEFVVVWNQYGDFDLWEYADELKPERGQFQPALSLQDFTVLDRMKTSETAGTPHD